MRIGMRTIKTAIGSGAAIAICQYMGLANYPFAGILTILCLRETVKRSYQDALKRFASCLIGMVFALVLLLLLGRHPWTFSIMMLLLIPTLVVFRLQATLTSACVIILHMYVSTNTGLELIWNEIQLITVGIGAALLMNTYMPRAEKQLILYRFHIEENFRTIFREIAAYLRTGSSDWSGREITETADMLQDAKRIAQHNLENIIFREEGRHYDYFQMRERQFELIERIAMRLSAIEQTYAQGFRIADFLEQLSEGVGPEDNGDYFLAKLADMRREFKNSPLPQNRQEFEDRAALLHYVNEMERYLLIKRDYLSKVE